VLRAIDLSLLFVHSETYTAPKRTTTPPPDPEKSDQPVVKTVPEAAERFVAPTQPSLSPVTPACETP